MTGTAAEARREFWQIYHLPVVVIPTNRPCIRTRQPDRVFATEDGQVERHRRGDPPRPRTRPARSWSAPAASRPASASAGC